MWQDMKQATYMDSKGKHHQKHDVNTGEEIPYGKQKKVKVDKQGRRINMGTPTASSGIGLFETLK